MGARINWGEAPDGPIDETENRRNDYNPCMTFEDGRPPLNVDQSLAADPTAACSWGKMYMPSFLKETQHQGTWCCLEWEDQERETLYMEEFGDGK